MPRTARTIEDEGIYHILNRGNGQQRVFQKDGDYQVFLLLLGQMKSEFGIDLFSYCLMPNHFHLLVKVQNGESLSRGMQWFMTTHVRRYHRHYRTSGHLWQGRYKNFAIQDDDHFLTVARYVEGNPVRAGLVETAADWVWSSHRGRCGIDTDSLIAPLPVHYAGNWTEFVDTPMTGIELAKVRKKIERQGDRLPN
ncbi:REP-associated tyrosine transposase [Geomobilimonas luticola]|uniref:Transposase n=1 Tax=Geomobilimonas luticola TaxID=1114878 RepID=A0ABS5SCK6_9BACT|nr:transposase [Geomobilimonas luticola]MBT0653100.1 transposase [Geomobilimonas luticola]